MQQISSNIKNKHFLLTFYAVVLALTFYIIILNRNNENSNLTQPLHLVNNEDTSLKKLLEDADVLDKETTATLKDDDETMKQYYQNDRWMFNINIMQFSSQIILLNNSNYSIEGMILKNKAASIVCILKSRVNNEIEKV